MFEYRDPSDTLAIENMGLSDLDLPEPIEIWSLEDFEELISGYHS